MVGYREYLLRPELRTSCCCDDIKIARKPGKKQKQNLIGCTTAQGKVKDEKEIKEGYGEDKTGTVCS